MEDFPVRFADFLENLATKVRELTVDRLNRFFRIAAWSLVAAVLVLAALVLAVIGAFRAIAVPLGDVLAYTVIGGVFVIAGAFIWFGRSRTPEEEEDA